MLAYTLLSFLNSTVSRSRLMTLRMAAEIRDCAYRYKCSINVVIRRILSFEPLTSILDPISHTVLSGPYRRNRHATQVESASGLCPLAKSGAMCDKLMCACAYVLVLSPLPLSPPLRSIAGNYNRTPNSTETVIAPVDAAAPGPDEKT